MLGGRRASPTNHLVKTFNRATIVGKVFSEVLEVAVAIANRTRVLLLRLI